METQRRELWAKRMEEYEASGLTLVEFATQTGCNIHTLRHWRARLSTAGRVSREGAGFVEVVPAGTKTTPTRVEGFELCLGNGRCLRIPKGFEADELSRLLKLLEAE